MAENDLSYSEAAARNLGKYLAALFSGLVAEGMTAEQALEVVKAWVSNLKTT